MATSPLFELVSHLRAAEILEVHPSTLSRWREGGFIKAIPVSHSAQKERPTLCYTLEEVKDFGKKVAFLRKKP